MIDTYAYIRDLPAGVPWIAEYPSRRSLEISERDLCGSYAVVHQHSSEPEDDFYPALEDGEVLLWHLVYGLVIAQSIDLNYFGVSLDKVEV
jgi:hypothetical protein